MTPTDLRSALNSLPLTEQAALRMRFGLVKDRPYEHGNAEIAMRLDITVSQANQIVAAGLHRLKMTHVPD